MTINQLLQKLDTSSPISATFLFGLRGKSASDNWWTLSSNCSSESAWFPGYPPDHPNRLQRTTTGTNYTYCSLTSGRALTGSTWCGRPLNWGMPVAPLSMPPQRLKKILSSPVWKRIRTPLPRGFSEKYGKTRPSLASTNMGCGASGRCLFQARLIIYQGLKWPHLKLASSLRFPMALNLSLRCSSGSRLLQSWNTRSSSGPFSQQRLWLSMT